MTGLVDPFGRRIEYLRLSVTDRCDFRCFYCIPKGYKGFVAPPDWLSAREIERLVGLFCSLGIRRVRLTGGEPLVRREIVEIAQRLGQLPGLQDLSLSTNAAHLARHAVALREAGIRRLNVSLDSLDPEVFRQITGSALAPVLEGLGAAQAAGFSPIKINMVVLAGLNDHQIGDMVMFCRDRGFTLRFIETMPIGESGRQGQNHFKSLVAVEAELGRNFILDPAPPSGGGPARYVRLRDNDLTMGFITPLSQHFCATCNRVRVSASGTLYPCLGQENSVALGPLLRGRTSDDEIRETLHQAIAGKPERHTFQEHPQRLVRIMAETGG
ncbi:GTP 3',8-cyclase [Gammaproteobacteria bacterium]